MRSFSKDARTVANDFNRFFTSVGQVAVDKINSLASECNFDLSPPVPDPAISPVTDQFNFTHVDCYEVAQIVRSMPANKSSGIDNIPVRVIKDSLPATLPVITSIINASFKHGNFPRSWKLAVVSPILKDGNHEEPNNNRPISLLPILSKVCERVALNQIMPYLVSNERLSTRQSGNKKLHSTETSLIRTTDTLLSAIDEKKVTAVVLLDMSKAFDTISHGILLNKLLNVAISPSSIAWFTSYLSDRRQVVRINSELSDPLPIVSGVPQGSILGPMLFSIYVNDLPLAPLSCFTESYVDDTKLYISFPVHDWAKSVTDLNADLLHIRNWCFNNRLLLNPDKTKLIVYGSRQRLLNLPDIRLSLLGKELTPEHVVKDLGVIFDSNLTFHEHIVKTVSTCFSSLAQINRVKHVFDRSTLITIINTLVFSKLFYCSSVWSNAADTNLLKLQAIQNFAARIICGSRKFDHVTPLLKELHWLPIKSQLYFRDAVLAFKCMTGSAPTYLSSKFLTRGNVSGRTTRSSQLLHIPLYKTKSGQRTFYYRTVSLWNSLDNDLKLCNSSSNFKRKLRAKLFAAFLSPRS